MSTTVITTRKYKGWWLYPVTNDEDYSVIDYWDIYVPCEKSCEKRIVKFVDGSFGYAQCVCWHDDSQPEATAHTLSEAKAIVDKLNTNYRLMKKFFRAFD